MGTGDCTSGVPAGNEGMSTFWRILKHPLFIDLALALLGALGAALAKEKRSE